MFTRNCQKIRQGALSFIPKRQLTLIKRLKIGKLWLDYYQTNRNPNQNAKEYLHEEVNSTDKYSAGKILDKKNFENGDVMIMCVPSILAHKAKNSKELNHHFDILVEFIEGKRSSLHPDTVQPNHACLVAEKEGVNHTNNFRSNNNSRNKFEMIKDYILNKIVQASISNSKAEVYTLTGPRDEIEKILQKSIPEINQVFRGSENFHLIKKNCSDALTPKEHNPAYLLKHENEKDMPMDPRRVMNILANVGIEKNSKNDKQKLQLQADISNMGLTKSLIVYGNESLNNRIKEEKELESQKSLQEKKDSSEEDDPTNRNGLH